MYPSEEYYNEKTLRDYLARTDNPAVRIFFEDTTERANQCLVWPDPELVAHAQQEIDWFICHEKNALYGQDKRFRRYRLSVLTAVYGLRFGQAERQVEQRFLFEC